MALKQQLTFEEAITAAYLHYVEGVEMQTICIAYHVNIGRVSEACKAIKFAARNPLAATAAMKLAANDEPATKSERIDRALREHGLE